MDPQEIPRYFSDELAEELEDYNKHRRRQNRPWIHTDFPRLDATMPRIGIEITNITHEPLSLGSSKYIMACRVVLKILVREKKTRFDIDGDGEIETERQVLHSYVKDITQYFQENFHTIKEDLDLRLLELGNPDRIEDQDLEEKQVLGIEYPLLVSYHD